MASTADRPDGYSTFWKQVAAGNKQPTRLLSFPHKDGTSLLVAMFRRSGYSVYMESSEQGGAVTKAYVKGGLNFAKKHMLNVNDAQSFLRRCQMGDMPLQDGSQYKCAFGCGARQYQTCVSLYAYV